MDPPPPSGDQFSNRALFQRSSDAVFILNKSRRLRYANPAWEKLTGKSLGDVYGLRCTRRRTDSSLSTLGRALNPPPEAMSGLPARVRRPPPGARLGPPWWEISVLPLAAADGLLGLIGVVRVVGSATAPKSRAIPEAVQRLRYRLRDRYRFDGLESDLPACRHVMDQARLACRHVAPVALVGEPGTGKRTLARVIHYGSASAERSFLAVDCAGLPVSVQEELVFGPCGLGQSDRVGTIFLRDPASLSRDLQDRLGHWLNDHPNQGPRLISAFERDPAADIAAGRMLDELFLALAIQVIHLIPLRERLDDIPRLAAAMLARTENVGVQKCPGLSPDALEVARAYSWPGNLRELEAALVHTANRSHGETIQPAHWPDVIRRCASRAAAVSASPGQMREKGIVLDSVLEQVERRLIVQAMGQAKGRHETAAELLGIWRTRLGRRLKALKIDDSEWQRFIPREPDEDATPPDSSV